MNRAIYDISMLVGLALAVAGVATMWGVGPALLAAGTGIIGLTALAVRL